MARIPPILLRWCFGGTLLLFLGACGADPLAPVRQIRVVGPADPSPHPGAQVVLAAEITRDGRVEPPGAFSYQWMKDGEAIPGAQAATLVFDAVTVGDSGSYQVRSGDLLAAPFQLLPADLALVVTSVEDAGPGTLREALAGAGAVNGEVGIRFQLPPGSTGTVRLQSDLPPIRGEVFILGPANAALVVDGSGAHRPFFVDGGQLILENFEVRGGLAKGGDAPGGGGGAAGMGGGMFINRGDVTLRGIVFRGNRVKNQNWESAVFSDPGSSPSSMEAGRIVDAYGLQD